MREEASAQDRWFDGRAQLISITRHDDARGCLLPMDFAQLPFTPQRLFTVSGAPAGTQRGGHGHHRGQQLLLCLAGQIGVAMACANERAEVLLDDQSAALLIGPGIWGQQTYLQPDSVLLVLASEPYDPASYFQHPGEST